MNHFFQTLRTSPAKLATSSSSPFSAACWNQLLERYVWRCIQGEWREKMQRWHKCIQSQSKDVNRHRIARGCVSWGETHSFEFNVSTWAKNVQLARAVLFPLCFSFMLKSRGQKGDGLEENKRNNWEFGCFKKLFLTEHADLCRLRPFVATKKKKK